MRFISIKIMEIPSTTNSLIIIIDGESPLPRISLIFGGMKFRLQDQPLIIMTMIKD